MHLSQSKLSEITCIPQARISAYELGKNGLEKQELQIILSKLESLDKGEIETIRKKRYQRHDHSGRIVNSRPRRGYKRTVGNELYLQELRDLERCFNKESQKKYTLTALSLFAGCGGLCYGIKAAGFKIVASSELVDAFRNIYHLNFPKTIDLPNDIRQIDTKCCKDILAKYGHIDLMAGGPPCQGFSLTGKRDTEDSRNTLFHDYLRIAEAIRPKVIVMENVRLLTSMKDLNGCLIKDRIMKGFQKLGYSANYFCINAKDYGVPQHRERVFFIGLRNDISDLPTIPKATFGEEADLFHRISPYRTFGDAVSDLEFLEAGESSQHDPWHFSVSHPEHVIEWLIDVPEGTSAHENVDPRLRPPSGYNTTYKRQIWDSPGSTVSTTFAMISGCRNVHPIATRSLTIREALRIQNFPDSFKLVGRLGDIRTSIGNAVPPLLSFRIAQHILKHYILKK